MRTAGDDAERLSDLQAKWGRAWKIWRAVRQHDGDWIATRLDPTAGIAPTVMADTPDALNDRLHDQAQYVAEGRKPSYLVEAGPE